MADVDLFIALTNDDENNIMSSLLAKRLGARRVIALINRKSYGDLMQGGQIDIAISPSYVTMSALLRFARRGDVVVAHTLRRAAAEALELIVHGDARSSRVIGKTIEQVEMPRGATIGAIVRGLGDQAQVLMAHHDVAIQAEDHLIIFVENKRIIPRVEKMFTVGLGFFVGAGRCCGAVPDGRYLHRDLRQGRHIQAPLSIECALRHLFSRLCSCRPPGTALRT